MNNLSYKFEKKGILSTILTFSLPSSFGAIIGMICFLTDRVFIGRVAGRDGMAAVALVFPYIMIINSFSFAFSGISIFSGIKLGEQQINEAEEILGCGFFSMIISGVTLSILLYFFNIPILKFFGATSTTIDAASQYTKYIIPIATFQMILGQTTLIRGVGDSFTAMFLNIFTGILNVILDYIFIIKLNMGLSGASLATFISTFCSSLYVFLYFFKSPVLKIRKKYLKLNYKILKEILKIGSPRFYNQLLQSSIITITNKQAGIYGGDIATAAIGIISICRGIMNTSLVGFNQGTAAIISYTFGSKNFERLKKVLKIQILIVTSISAILVIFMLGYTPDIIKLFVKNDPDLVTFTSSAMKLNLFLMPFTALFLACNNFFQSIKENKISSNMFFLRILGLNIPLVYILGYYFQNTGVWLAFPLSDTIAGIIMFYLTSKKIKCLKAN